MQWLLRNGIRGTGRWGLLDRPLAGEDDDEREKRVVDIGTFFVR